LSASAPARAGRPRRSRHAIWWTVGFLLLVELATRAVAGRLPEPLLWYSLEAQTKVAQMEDLRRQGWEGGVVFVGTSMMNVALDPLELARTAGEQTTFAYNASLSAGIPRLMEEWVRGVVFPKLRPSVLVIGLSSVDFNDASAHREALLHRFEQAPAARLALGRASVIERLDDVASRVSAFVRYRRAFRDPKRLFDALMGRPARTADPNVGAFGAGVGRRADDFELPEPVDRANGTLADYRPGGREQAAIARIIELAKRMGTRVLLVKMPVTTEYIATHPNGAADYLAFEQALAGLAAAFGVPVVDAQAAATGHRYFADDSHLNGRGTEAFTRLMAVELETRGLVAAPDSAPTPPVTPEPEPTLPVLPTAPVPLPSATVPTVPPVRPGVSAEPTLEAPAAGTLPTP
jgi:hypothetical protein